MYLSTTKEVLKYLQGIYRGTKSTKSVNKFYNFSKSSITDLGQLIRLSDIDLEEKLDNLDSLHADDFAEWIISLVDTYSEDVAVEVIDRISE